MNIKEKRKIVKLLRSLFLRIGERYEGWKWEVVRISSTDFIVRNKTNKSEYEASFDIEKNRFYIKKVVL